MVAAMPRAAGAREILDGTVACADREASLADVARLSRLFGGYALTLRALWRHLPAAPGAVVVDVGGGRGDFARRVIRRARREGRGVRVIVVDRDPDLLAAAATTRGTHPELGLVRADATALPFRDGSVDVVTMSLLLHHLEPAAAVASLRGMRRIARRAVVVNDLLRSRLTYALVWLATRLLARHPISRHDGPLSVRRAYAPAEVTALAAQAGIATVHLARYRALGRLLTEVTR